MVDSAFRAAYKSAGIRDQIGLIHYWNWAWSDGCSPLPLRLDVPVMDFWSSFGLSPSPLLRIMGRSFTYFGQLRSALRSCRGVSSHWWLPFIWAGDKGEAQLSHSLDIQSLILPDLCTPKVANPSSFSDMRFFGQNRDIEEEFTLSRFSWNR